MSFVWKLTRRVSQALSPQALTPSHPIFYKQWLCTAVQRLRLLMALHKHVPKCSPDRRLLCAARLYGHRLGKLCCGTGATRGRHHGYVLWGYVMARAYISLVSPTGFSFKIAKPLLPGSTSHHQVRTAISKINVLTSWTWHFSHILHLCYDTNIQASIIGGSASSRLSLEHQFAPRLVLFCYHPRNII